MLLHEDAQFMQARQDRLERLYSIDGRHDPGHPWHGTFTHLHAKFNGISTPRDEDLPA